MAPWPLPDELVVKMAGAAADIVSDWKALTPLLYTRRDSDELAVASYGICTFN